MSKSYVLRRVPLDPYHHMSDHKWVISETGPKDYRNRQIPCRVWQISKHSFGWETTKFRGFMSGRATTLKQAIDRAIAAYMTGVTP